MYTQQQTNFYIAFALWVLFVILSGRFLVSAIIDYIRFNSNNVIKVTTKVELLKEVRKKTKRDDYAEYYTLYTLKLDYKIKGKSYSQIVKESQSNEIDKAINDEEMIIYCKKNKPKKYWLESYYNHYKKLSSLIAPLIVAILFSAIPTYGLYLTIMDLNVIYM